MEITKYISLLLPQHVCRVLLLCISIRGWSHLPGEGWGEGGLKWERGPFEAVICIF